MAKAAKGKTPDKDGLIPICRNRRATYDYEILETLECGIVLVGTEVKSLREAHATLDDSYGLIQNDELYLLGCEIPEYWAGNRLNHKPKRERKLLVHKREITKFAAKAAQKGFTIVPLRMYFKDGKVKVEIAVAKGKQTHDKRHAIKDAEAKRDIDRAMAKKFR